MEYYLEKYYNSKVDLNITSNEKNTVAASFYSGYLIKVTPHFIFFLDTLGKRHYLTNVEATITFLHYVNTCKPNINECPKVNVFCNKDYCFYNCYLINVCNNTVEIITENKKHIVLYGYSMVIDYLE